jgi:hypothetical protein
MPASMARPAAVDCTASMANVLPPSLRFTSRPLSSRRAKARVEPVMAQVGSTAIP